MRERNFKIITIIILLVGIIGLSIGFAAFSNTLKISSSANITPDESTFSVGFNNVTCTKVGNATIVNNAQANGTTISGLNVELKGPGDEVNCTATVKNTGKYIAYLTSITSGKISCTKGSNASADLVNAACNSITMPVAITGTKSFSETITTTYELGYSKYSGHSLAINGTDTVNFSIKYSGSNRADGEFTINVPSITLTYSTLDQTTTNSDNLLLFTIDDVEYRALKGMTWEDWVNSEYNTNGFTTGKFVDFTTVLCSQKGEYVAKSPLGGLHNAVSNLDLISSENQYSCSTTIGGGSN